MEIKLLAFPHFFKRSIIETIGKMLKFCKYLFNEEKKISVELTSMTKSHLCLNNSVSSTMYINKMKKKNTTMSY